MDEEERHIVYNYMSTVYPKLNKSILRVNSLDSEIMHFRPKHADCYHCDNGRGKLTNYNYGSLPNNKDEYYSGLCNECGRNVYFEPNYDMPKEVRRNNVIAFGNWFKGYNTEKN